jgi:hypothetical protein
MFFSSCEGFIHRHNGQEPERRDIKMLLRTRARQTQVLRGLFWKGIVGWRRLCLLRKLRHRLTLRTTSQNHQLSEEDEEWKWLGESMVLGQKNPKSGPEIMQSHKVTTLWKEPSPWNWSKCRELITGSKSSELSGLSVKTAFNSQ